MRSQSISKHNLLSAGCRFDAEYHLSEGVSIRRRLHDSGLPVKTIGDCASRIFYGIRANRVYVTKRENAIPFMTGANIMLANLRNCKLVSSVHTPAIDEMTIHKGWIMVTRSGTVGQTAFSNGIHEGKYGSEDIIRIIPNDTIKPGVIYAYLASKYGQTLLTQGAFGAVIQHIEPSFIEKIQIPVFAQSIQEKVDSLVVESAKLREEAASAENEAHRLIEEYFSSRSGSVVNSGSVSSKKVLSSHTHRLEATYYVSSNRSVYDIITQNFSFTTLGDAADRIFRPGIFKRQYVAKGVPFLGGADIMLATPSSGKEISKKQVERMPELLVEKGWILITCGGTIGNAVYVDEQLSKCAISQHVIRIKPKEVGMSGFLYAFLTSEIGYQLITLFSYGSVIPQVEPHHLSRIPIPSFPKELVDKTNSLIETFSELNNKAKELQQEAIELIESEMMKMK